MRAVNPTFSSTESFIVFLITFKLCGVNSNKIFVSEYGWIMRIAIISPSIYISRL